jgi:hypothetical protein
LKPLKRIAAGSCSLMLAATTALADGGAVKAVYCWQETKGEWSLHRFKPLINPQGRTVFAEMSFEGSALGEVRLRRFYPSTEVVFDYKFDPAGKLNGLKGTVSVFGEWTAEANLFPNEDGTVPPYRVSYIAREVTASRSRRMQLIMLGDCTRFPSTGRYRTCPVRR